nr:hypothetical protein [Alistipes onderdonkii]
MNNRTFHKQNESRIRLLILIKLLPWLFIGLILMIGLIRDCSGPDVDPMDNSYMKEIGIVDHVYVVDSTHNGFRAVYKTVKPVTDARLQEIRTREKIRTTFERLQHDAPIHFGGSLLYTDIYDFADFAKQYDVGPDVELHNIFVMGYEKMNLYIGPNPGIENSARWMNMGTEQGNQYLSSREVFRCSTDTPLIYRYWKCRAPYDISLTDERFSHFSEEERLY